MDYTNTQELYRILKINSLSSEFQLSLHKKIKHLTKAEFEVHNNFYKSKLRLVIPHKRHIDSYKDSIKNGFHDILLENTLNTEEDINIHLHQILSGLNNGTTTNNVIVSKYPNTTNKTSSNVSTKKAQSLQMSSSKTNANLAAKLAKG